LAIQGVDLRDLGFIFERWMNVRVQNGILGLYAEAAAAQGECKGYVKPVIDGMRVQRLRAGVLARLRGWAFKALAFILRNKQADRISTRLDFSGRFHHFDFAYASAAMNSLKNAFSHAFKPRLDH